MCERLFEPEWPGYHPGGFHDEIVGPDGRPREAARALARQLRSLGPDGLVERQRAAEEEVRALGITYTLYDKEAGGAERSWPFDVIPRIIGAAEWRRTEVGLVQRLSALNCFIEDVYHDQRIIRAGVVPAELVLGSPNFRPECVGASPAGGIWAHICGSDLVRDADGTLYVLEDNLRVPSGVSYVLENRLLTKRVFPGIFRDHSIEPIDQYVGRLADLLTSLAPHEEDPTAVVLTPGVHNSAYFEHAYLARQLGIELVEGRDLVVVDGRLHARAITGLVPVHVVYRRIDDTFLDPEAFRPDSLIGVPGMMRAWREGNVALVNAPGSGVADDKAIYSFVPDMIRYYLGEDAILANVPTWRCADETSRRHVLASLDRLVVKPANESGGHGVLIGPSASPLERQACADRIVADPRGWVAQPTLALSTAPTLCEGRVEPRHVDLRPFTLFGPEGRYVSRGGLTRVARRAGSLVVNSSQGGGSKDTWVVGPAAAERPIEVSS